MHAKGVVDFYPGALLNTPINSFRNSIFESRSSLSRLKVLLTLLSRSENASGTKRSCLCTPSLSTKVDIRALAERSSARLRIGHDCVKEI